MGCSSNKAENTVISKEEREEILNKTTDEIFAANEMRIIELESKNILDFLTLKMPKTHSSYIEYFLYFISSLQENLFNINKKKEAKQLDSQALKLIRINLQKIQELIKTDSNFHEIKEDSRNGSILTKILQEFETNIKVIIKGNLVILISKAMLKEKEGKFSKEFSFILSSSFWLESQNIEKLEIYNYFMNWSDFKRNFIEFSDRNWKISLNEKELALLLKTTDVKNERKIHYKDWDSFYKDKWVHWIKRSQFFEEAKAMEPIKEYNTIEKIDKETTNLDINESDIVSIETKKLSIEQNGKSNNLNTIIIEIKKEESEESNSKAFELNKQDSNYFFQEKMDEKLHERTNNSKSISYNQKKEPKIEIKNEENIHKKSEDSPKQKLVHFQKNELKESQNTNFIDKNHEKSTKIENLEKVTQQENKSTNKLKKSNTVRISDKNAYVKSQGKKIKKNLIERVQMLEKHFNGNINKELENEEEKKEQSLASRKRSESFDCHERCSSRKKTIHKNLLDRIAILEKHFGGGGEDDEKEFPILNKNNEELEDLKHLTLGRPRHPYKYKKKSMIRNAKK